MNCGIYNKTLLPNIFKNSNGILNDWEKDVLLIDSKENFTRVLSSSFRVPNTAFNTAFLPSPSSPALDDGINGPKVIVYH